MTRAEIEALRGIVRNSKGEIIRSDEWKVKRVQLLYSKLQDCENRIRNIKTELHSYGVEFEEVNVASWWSRFVALLKELFLKGN